MRTPIILIGAACLLAGVAAHAHNQRDLGRETLHPENGWAASGSGVTGGSAAVDAQIYMVTNRAELIAALNNGVSSSTSPANPSNEPKIIYVQGHDRRERRRCELSRSRAPTTTATASRSSNSSRPTIRLCGAAFRRPAPSRLRAWLRSRRSRRACASARARTRRSSVSAATRPSAARGSTSAALPTWRTAARNIIVRNITFQDTFDCFPAWAPTDGALGSWNSQYDSISLRDTNNVWIDHNTFEDRTTADSTLPLHFGVLFQVHDGLVDITNASDLVTVSWNRFRNHDKMMLIGSSDSAAADRGKLRVTLHHNLFDGIGQRVPRVRFGQVHVYNNSTTCGRLPTTFTAGASASNRRCSRRRTSSSPNARSRSTRSSSVSTARRLSVSGTLVIGPRVRNPVDVVAAWNAVNDPDLGFDAGWTPTLNHRVAAGVDDAAARAAVRRSVALIRVAAASCVLVLAAIACARSSEPQAAEASRHVRNRFFVREDAAVAKVEPAPHGNLGDSTAYRYFDDVTDARVIFRKRALHKGSGNRDARARARRGLLRGERPRPTARR